MNELTRLALSLEKFWREKGWEACIIGGLAVQAWGEPRFTMDVDITVLAGLGREEEFVDGWLAEFPSRIPDAKPFAVFFQNSIAGHNNTIYNNKDEKFYSCTNINGKDKDYEA